MSDKVIGVAVLDRTRTNAPESEWLHILCAYPDGTKRPEGIPVEPKGTNPKKHWQYEILGETLRVTPSVRISTTKPDPANPDKMIPVELFHNDGQWDVSFKEFLPGEYVQAFDLFRALNPK